MPARIDSKDIFEHDENFFSFPYMVSSETINIYYFPLGSVIEGKGGPGARRTACIRDKWVLVDSFWTIYIFLVAIF
jgi:hypothetical protein